MAAGVGVTRLARSARSIRRTGVVFVPLAGDYAETVIAWNPGRDSPACRQLRELAGELGAVTNLAGQGREGP